MILKILYPKKSLDLIITFGKVTGYKNQQLLYLPALNRLRKKAGN
jgi:hypothetical protein